MAMSVLPVNRTTLIYGTSDGGIHVHNKNEVFSQKMQKMNQRLNLKAHTCGAQKRKTKVLYSAADVEGHLGLDGEFYLLDFSRTLPPVRPDSRFLNGHLYQLFRREFVENYVTPLCSDAYSGFVMHDKKREEHDKDVHEATTYLFSNSIPNCASQLVQVDFSFFFSSLSFYYFFRSFFPFIIPNSTVKETWEGSMLLVFCTNMVLICDTLGRLRIVSQILSRFDFLKLLLVILVNAIDVFIYPLSDLCILLISFYFYPAGRTYWVRKIFDVAWSRGYCSSY